LARPAPERSPASSRGFAAFAPDTRVRLRPAGLLEGAAAAAAIDQGRALPLGGGPVTFAEVEALARAPGGGSISAYGTVTDLLRWSAEQWPMLGERIANGLAAVVAPRRPWAGLALDHPRLMAVLDVSPAGSSLGESDFDPAPAIAQGQALLAAGADIIDISSDAARPGGAAVSPDEETRRLEPVIRALVEAGAVVSVGTRRAAVAGAGLAAGARIISDPTALAGDEQSLAVAAESGAAVVLMHAAADPQELDKSRYEDAAFDVLDFLEARIAACEAAGIPRERLAVDPGIGFGKADPRSRALMERLTLFHTTGCAVVVGAARKVATARAGRGESGKGRIGGSLAAALWAASQGVQILRVQDVAETRQALIIRQAIVRGAPLALS
jgi:dihydropteroate synthase